MSKKVGGFILILFCLSGCVPEDQTDVFWNSINTKEKYTPFVFVFSNTQIPTCAKHAQPKLEKILNGDINDIISEDVNGCMMFPSILDPQYSNIAEELKFLFDQNGNNTFNTWPAYVNNLTCYNIDSTIWYESIRNSQNQSPTLKLGIKSTASNKEIKIYVKGEYSSSVSEHSVAVYAYRKSELANQTTDSGSENFRVKNKIIYALTPTIGKSLNSNSPGEEFREVFTLEISNEDLSNLGFIAVVYHLENNVPFEVINSIKLDEL
tara:strand:- start:1167 stop:1961 length:795 start_codon:yes stop_codon:yes gene_type:complete